MVHKQVDPETYVWFCSYELMVISSDSKNVNNIEQLRNKGIGIQNKIIEMLERMPGAHTILKSQLF